MMSNRNSLDRLFNIKDENEPQEDYSFEEQLQSASEDDDLLAIMSPESKKSLMERVQPETLQEDKKEEQEEEEEIQPKIEEKKKRGRKKKEPQEEMIPHSILDVLALDCLEALADSEFTFHHFSKEDCALIIRHLEKIVKEKLL